jgi:hypothetical protein
MKKPKPTQKIAPAKNKRVSAIELLESLAERIASDALLVQMILDGIKSGQVEVSK